MRVLAGLYRDGKTAEDHPVEIRVLGHGLEIVAHDSPLVERWPLARIARDGDTIGAALRLRCADFPAARLVIADGQDLAALLPQRQTKPWLWAGLAAGAALVLGLTFWGLPHLASAAAHMVPIEAERAWGRAMAREIEDDHRACTRPDGMAALAVLQQKLALVLPEPQRPSRVVVVEHPMVNAVALPGGTIIVFDGLLRQADTADEVAGVLAHEMAHVAERHPLIAGIRSVGLAALVTLFTGDLSAVAATIGGMALAGNYSRQDESSADALAVEILHQAGISPQGLASFFAKLADQGGEIPQWLSTHPELDARRQAVEAATWGQAFAPALDASQWQALKDICPN
ncbi:Putative peptidase family M48 protein [Magnetospirillum gryphiswaldense MSR-1 v2]|uniref:Peptidase family M48 protein n=1 Tax=Magnetospirillum gryphiswaldense (strain DSM 6361 / JCM 21280 / NBRC 15271 / MSR-1) TaxID=431944 RepID=V6EX09_MAGGM|nr:M48 family metallopeptidase [Magnetospirillum gryphiswaldense]CDK97729.1 Putative peptidase family M48 protein [Magnetospirillum gryphiswaldense MSR-1 v2]